MSTVDSAHPGSRYRFRLAAPQLILTLLLTVEVVVFGVIGTNFLTVKNALEVMRVSVEIGLIAVALTPVIVSGGIDLSVGSLMGLSAVVFGKLWRDAGLPVGEAAALTLALGAAAGALNGLLITRLRLPALIVTLGSFSLFRGLAEGITRGADNFTNFPDSFLVLGQGDLFGRVPAQVPVFVAVALAFWLLLHRSTIGRGLVAIGFSPEGARHAGIPVARRVGLVYLLSGLVSSLASVIYVAHLGQAKADAGTGYELLAITAVVLGGTSIFGGRGTVAGTVLGLFAIAVMQNGLRLADLPSEFAGVMTGVLLLIAIGLDRKPATAPIHAHSLHHDPAQAEGLDEGFTVKNSQVAVICVAILAGALIIAGANVLMFRTLVQNSLPGRAPISDARFLPTPTVDEGPAPQPHPATAPLTIAMMGKSKGNAYHVACHNGGEEAAKELGVKVIWDAPTDPDPARQNEIVDTWITRGVDAIVVAVENRDGLSSALRRARAKGIKVITYDADAQTDARDFFVNQATPEGIGEALMANASRLLGPTGEFAIVTASLTASNMIEWQKAIEKVGAAKYPGLKMVTIRPCDDLTKKAFDESNTIMNAYPKVRLIMAICSPAVPGAAEAVKQAGRKDVKVIGLGLPSENRRYVKEGVTDCITLWKPVDLGYLAIYAAHHVKLGQLEPGDTSISAGRLGTIEIKGDNIMLGKPINFTKENIDRFDF